MFPQFNRVYQKAMRISLKNKIARKSPIRPVKVVERLQNKITGKTCINDRNHLFELNYIINLFQLRRHSLKICCEFYWFIALKFGRLFEIVYCVCELFLRARESIVAILHQGGWQLFDMVKIVLVSIALCTAYLL